MPRGSGHRPVSAGRRHSPVHAGILARGWWVFPTTALGVIALTVLVVREHAKEARTANGFPPEDIAAAKLVVLPYRKSGLIFSWENEEPTVSVTRAMWERLPQDAQKDLGQAMAVAKNQKQVRIRDGKSGSLIAICTAAGRCHKEAVESTFRRGGVDAGAESLPQRRE